MYEKYKVIRSKEEFFAEWIGSSLSGISESIKDQIYKKYVCKCVVFQRDNFKCQNELCKAPTSHITMHHIKFQKNGGEDKPKNCITICKSCQSGFHRGKAQLKFWGMIYQIDGKTETMNYKAIIMKGKEIRKANKHLHGYKISYELLMLLLRWLDEQISYQFLNDKEQASLHSLNDEEDYEDDDCDSNSVG